MTTSGRPEHHTRELYYGYRGALIDALRVSSELVRQIDTRPALLIDPAEVEFLARRAQDLVRLCLTTLPADLQPADQGDA